MSTSGGDSPPEVANLTSTLARGKKQFLGWHFSDRNHYAFRLQSVGAFFPRFGVHNHWVELGQFRQVINQTDSSPRQGNLVAACSH